MKKRSSVVLCVLALLLLFAASPVPAQDAYTVGCTMAITGPGSDTYAPIKEAMDLYFKEVNAKGGINGHPVKILYEDNAAEPSKAAAHANKFATQDKVILSMLCSLSSTYAPVVRVAQQYNIPLYFGGAVCPESVYPPNADANQFCSTAFGYKYDSRFAIPFLKEQAKSGLKLALVAMNIPVSRAEIDYAEQIAKEMGIEVVDKQATPPPTPDYTPYATKIKDSGANWVYTWAPWASQIRTFEALRKIGWKGNYVAYAHINAEDELKRLKDDGLFVFGSNAFFSDDTPTHQRIKAASESAKSLYPYTQLTEGWITAMVLEAILKKTPWPPTPEKVRNAMNQLNVDTKGLKGGPLVWTESNHFRTVAYYRAYKWQTDKSGIGLVKDWTPVEVK
jgi:ABC-type branched-subunit amino acid transport system substrate-binding protein